MTTLQEAPDIADIIAGALQVSRGTAYDLMRTALAQQEADKPFQPDWVNYRQGVEDGKAEALLAQQGERKNCPQPEICGSKECEFCRDTAAPAPQAQDKSDNYLSGYCTGRTDLLKEQSAQPVAQPLAKTCDTCAHYQQGKHPGVSIHDETCYECRSYWGNKWEAA